MTTLDADMIELFRDAITAASGKTHSAFRADQRIAEIGLDSVATLEMVSVLEERLEIRFAEEALARVVTFGDLASLVKRALNKV